MAEKKVRNPITKELKEELIKQVGIVNVEVEGSRFKQSNTATSTLRVSDVFVLPSNTISLKLEFTDSNGNKIYGAFNAEKKDFFTQPNVGKPLIVAQDARDKLFETIPFNAYNSGTIDINGDGSDDAKIIRLLNTMTLDAMTDKGKIQVSTNVGQAATKAELEKIVSDLAGEIQKAAAERGATLRNIEALRESLTEQGKQQALLTPQIEGIREQIRTEGEARAAEVERRTAKDAREAFVNETMAAIMPELEGLPFDNRLAAGVELSTYLKAAPMTAANRGLVLASIRRIISKYTGLRKLPPVMSKNKMYKRAIEMIDEIAAGR